MKIDRRHFLAAGASALAMPSILFAAENRGTAYINARVWTGVAKSPMETAIAITGSRIAAVGEKRVRELIAREKGGNTRVVDLEGAFVAPGFVDNHTHFLLAAATLVPPDLRRVRTREEFVRRLEDAARHPAPGGWVGGGKWGHELWGGGLPTREWVDGGTPQTPVSINRTAQT